MTEIDPSLNEKVASVSKALEGIVVGLVHQEPLDTSKVNEAISHFDSRQDQANALCSAVKQINPLRAAKDIHIPPLEIEGQKGGTDWAALRVFANIISNDNMVTQETLYVLPVTQLELSNVKCDIAKTQQAGALSNTDTASLGKLHPPK